MNRPAILRTMIATPWGHFSPGLEVTAVAINGPTVTVCLDNNYHPTGTCHYAGVPRNHLTIAHDRQHQAA